VFRLRVCLLVSSDLSNNTEENSYKASSKPYFAINTRPKVDCNKLSHGVFMHVTHCWRSFEYQIAVA